MIKNLSAISTSVQPLINNSFYSPPSSFKGEKTPTSPQNTEKMTSGSLLSITPRKLEAVALIISSISELISQIREVIKSYQTARAASSAVETGQAQGGSSTPMGAPQATPSAAQNTMIPTAAPSTAINLPTAASQEPPLANALTQITAKLSELEQMLSSLIGISGASTSPGQNSMQAIESNQSHKHKKNFFGDLLGSIGTLAKEFIPGKEILYGAGALIKSGGKFLKSIFSGIF